MTEHDDRNGATPDDIHLRIQALADNELPESEIEPLLETIQGSYEYRAEYAALLRLRRRLGPGPAPDTDEEWLQKAERRISRRISRPTGTVLLVGSYVLLFAYALYALIREPGIPILVSVLVIAGVVGFVVLLVNAIADRVREGKSDRYRGVIR